MRWIFGVMAVIGLGTPELAWAESLAQTDLCEFMNQETTRRSQWQQSQFQGMEFELPNIKAGWAGADSYESWTKSQWKANHIDPNPLDDIQELQGLKSAHTLLSYVDNPWEKMDQNVKEVLSSLYQRSQSLNQSKGLVRQVLKKHGCSSDVVDQYTTSEITSSTVLPELAEQIDPALKTPNWFEDRQLGSLSEGIKDKLLKLCRTAAWDKSEYNAPCAQALQTAESICSGLVSSEQVYFFLQEQQGNNKKPSEKLAADSGGDNTQSANNLRADNTNKVTVRLPSGGTSPSGDANFAKFSFHNVQRFEQYGWPKMLKGIHNQVRDCRQIRRQSSCNLKLAMRDLEEIRDHQLQDSRFNLNPSPERTFRRANFDQGLPHCYIKTPECMGRIDQHLKKSGYDGGLDEFCQFQSSPTDICGPPARIPIEEITLEMTGGRPLEFGTPTLDRLHLDWNHDGARAGPRRLMNQIPAGMGGGSPIRGFTKHGLNRAIGGERLGVKPSAIHEAVKHPTKISNQPNGAVKFVGKDANVVINSQGQVITTYPTNRNGVRKMDNPSTNNSEPQCE